MKTFKVGVKIIMLAFFIFSFATPASAFKIPENVIIAFRAGNSKELAKFFNNSIELIILDKGDLYSKSQAELIIRDFFSKNSPTNFVVIHEGGKDGTRYGIGKLTTSNRSYRVYFLFKTQDGASRIHQLRIEQDND